MRKVVFHTPGPYCNTETNELFEFDDGTPDAEIYDAHFEWIVSIYDMYGVEPSEEDDIDLEYDGSWSDYDPAKHDGIL